MKKLICLDMDGTVYLGDKLFDGVIDTINFLKEKDIDFVFLTNNSSHSLEFYKEKMERMGIECNTDNFYSSIDTTIKYLLKMGAHKIFVLGVKSFKEKLAKYFTLIESYDRNNPVDVVLVSFDTELVYKELSDACLYIQDGAKFIATNMDYRCPIEDGYYIPDCGGLCKWIEMCTNIKPKFLGKPEPEMIYQVMEKFNVSKNETLMVGDRYYTDIMSGINAGVDTVGVLTGETTKEEFEQSNPKPTYILKSVNDIKKFIL